MATKKIKINFKMPTSTAAERLHAQQQKNRKAAGLPDPSEYKKKLDSMKTEQLEKKGRFVSGPVKHPFKSSTIVTSVKESFRIGGMGSGGRGNIHMYDRNPGPKDGSELEHVPFHAKTEKQKKLQNALNDLGKKMKEKYPHLKEGDDDITVFKKGSNVKQKIKANSYDTFKFHGFRKVSEAKDSQEYDYEGDMAKSDLRSIMHHAKELHDMLDDDTNLAEWCQSKITLAEDYLSTVANYMRSEMNEETIEEDKNDYQRKIEKNNKNFIAASKRQKNPLTNVHTAQTKQKPVKEDVEQLDEYESKGGTYTHKGSYGRQKTGPDSSKYTKPHTAGGSELKNSETTSLEKGMGVTWGRKSLGKAQSKETLMNVHKNLPEEVEQLDEKKNLPGLWANIRAKKARGESPAKPGEKDYPEDLESVRSGGKKSVKESVVPFDKPYKKDSGTTTDKSGAKHTPMSKARHLARQAMNKNADKPVKESAAEPTEGEIKGKQGYSRKAQIVMNASKGKKSDNPDKFQKDPELSSEIHKT